MPAREEIEGIVLEQREAGEKHVRLSVFSRSEGLLICLRNRPKKSAGHTHSDLFDVARIQLERSGKSSVWFVGEYHLERRFGGLGTNYKALSYACEWSRLLLANLRHLPEFDYLWQLTMRALEAWENRPRPDITYLKTLFLFIREEGLPIQDQWLARQPRKLQEVTISAITLPLDEQTVTADEVAEVLASLRHWMAGYTDIVVEMGSP